MSFFKSEVYKEINMRKRGRFEMERSFFLDSGLVYRSFVQSVSCQPLLKMSQNKSISDTKKTLHKQNMQTRQISYAKV